MISIFKYISSKRRLNSSNETIKLMGGERNCGSFYMAQHEMLAMEVNYFLLKARAELLYIILITGVGYAFYEVLKVYGWWI